MMTRIPIFKSFLTVGLLLLHHQTWTAAQAATAKSAPTSSSSAAAAAAPMKASAERVVELLSPYVVKIEDIAETPRLMTICRNSAHAGNQAHERSTKRIAGRALICSLLEKIVPPKDLLQPAAGRLLAWHEIYSTMASVFGGYPRQQAAKFADTVDENKLEILAKHLDINILKKRKDPLFITELKEYKAACAQLAEQKITFPDRTELKTGIVKWLNTYIRNADSLLTAHPILIRWYQEDKETGSYDTFVDGEKRLIGRLLTRALKHKMISKDDLRSSGTAFIGWNVAYAAAMAPRLFGFKYRETAARFANKIPYGNIELLGMTASIPDLEIYGAEMASVYLASIKNAGIELPKEDKLQFEIATFLSPYLLSDIKFAADSKLPAIYTSNMGNRVAYNRIASLLIHHGIKSAEIDEKNLVLETTKELFGWNFIDCALISPELPWQYSCEDAAHFANKQNPDALIALAITQPLLSVNAQLWQECEKAVRNAGIKMPQPPAAVAEPATPRKSTLAQRASTVQLSKTSSSSAQKPPSKDDGAGTTGSPSSSAAAAAAAAHAASANAAKTDKDVKSSVTDSKQPAAAAAAKVAAALSMAAHTGKEDGTAAASATSSAPQAGIILPAPETT